MSLKQDIVVVNEFSVPLGQGRGSRGGTPGEYVSRYMARMGATEPVAPIKLSPIDEYVKRYMAREEAVETVHVPNVEVLKKRMAQGSLEGGRAFGYGTFSLSDDQLKAASADLQRLFDEGHTVLKTVVSFDHDYLVRQGIVEEGFQVTRRGDYRGNVDQLKLRFALMQGLDRMGRAKFDDLRYIGTIQVDTEHLHVHLAMVDAGKGTVAKDGNQKGKLDKAAISMLRRGIDAFLDEKQSVAHLSSAVGYERQNVVSYVKRWAHDQILRESLPQLLIAALPADRRKWRYATNDQTMKRANAIVEELVEEVLERPGSPMGEAMASVMDYANHRRTAEGLNDAEWAQLVDTGRERIIERGVNALYQSLRNLPKETLQLRTPILDVMGMDYSELANRARNENEDDLVGFGYRLRSYSARLHEHDDKRAFAREEMSKWEKAYEAGVAAPESRPFYDWWRFEENYHARLASKYRHFLPPIATEGKWASDLRVLEEYSDRLDSLKAMINDSSLKRMTNLDAAEEMGLSVYGQRGGRLVASKDQSSKDRLEARVEAMEAERERRIAQLQAQLAKAGRLLIVESDRIRTEEAEEFDFDAVKGLDLHHMGFDFPTDVKVGIKAREEFLQAAKARQKSLLAAVDYLESSGQGALAQEVLDIKDVMAMDEIASKIEAQDPKTTVLESRVAKLAAAQKYRRSPTFRLGEGIGQNAVRIVEQEVASFEPNELDEIDRSKSLGS